MNKYRSLNYFALWLTGLFLLSVQAVSATDTKIPNATLQTNTQGTYPATVLTSDTPPLMIPEFKSEGLHLAHYTADTPAPHDPSHAATDTAKPKAAGGDASLAAKATNPIANLMQFQVQNSFIPESWHASGYSNAFVLQPVIPIKLSKDGFFPFMITRTTLPVLTTPDPDGPVGGTTGLGDMTILALPIHEQKMGSWGAMWGVGLATEIPTATDERTGTGQFSLGPSAVLFLEPSKSIQTGVLGYHVWDITGGSNDRAFVSKTYFQPILNYHFDSLFGQDGWYLGMQDIMWSYDWNAQKLDLPIGVRLGRVFKAGKMPLNVFFEPFGRPISGSAVGTGKYGFKLNVTFLFPE